LSGNEYRVNADATTDWRHPVYEPVGQLSPETSNAVLKLAGYREKRVENRQTEHVESNLEPETKAAAFDAFWARWPRRQAKAAARRAWMKIPISEYSSVMAGLEKYRMSDQWTRGVIPHAATWLSDKRWQDDDIPQSAAIRGTTPRPSLDEMRQKRSSMTKEGKALLEKAGGLIQ